jgi:signal transduction histidine kinase/ligand-binding sensor domain-containing protein/DNA-binding NarL/FixJ family response regulator
MGLLWLLSPLTVFPQKQDTQPSDQFFIQQLDNRNGLSNSSINHIFKDRDSILWVATWDGLNMYDGKAFHVFNYGKEDRFKSIGSNVIQRITEDKAGNIWISTIEGVSRYDKRTGIFHNYFYNQYQRSSISEQEYELAVDTSGNVFCLTSRSGLNYYDQVADSFRTCVIPGTPSGITALAFDEADRLWLLNRKGELAAFSGTAARFLLVKSIHSENIINRFYHINGSVFYSTDDDRLFAIDEATLSPRLVLQMNHGISAMAFYRDHYLVAWSTKGYGVFDARFRPSGFLGAEARQMQDIKVTSLAGGSEQIIWFGTDGNGIIKIYPKTKTFGIVSTADNGNPYNKSVRAFCEENGNLWYGTKGNGITRIQQFRAGSPLGDNKEYFLAPQQLDNNSVYALKRGWDDLIYIGTDGKGLGVYDIRAQKFIKWQAIGGHDLYPEFGSVYAILQDPDHSLWLGTSGYGLIHLSVSRDPTGVPVVTGLERFIFSNDYSNDDKGPANDIIYALADGGNDQLWIGCRYGGLSLLDKRTRKFRTFKAFTHEGSLSNNDVLSLCRDSRGRVWVGTSYGLNWTDGITGPATDPVFKKLTTANGLPNNTIHGITEDSMGDIWVSTNRGLAKVEPDNQKISNYQQIDGLQSNEFCDGAVYKDANGQLFFGGTYGFNYFLPQNIRKTNWLPNLLIANIIMSGKAANDNSFAVMRPDTASPLFYKIERKEDFFELDVRALSFLNAEKCEYAYFLEGYDKIWHYPGTTGKIAYSNILPGAYTLKIKWSNGEGIWTKEIPMMDLEVKQYLWLTSWALLIYGLVLSAIGYMIYRYRKNKLEIKHQLEMEHVMRTREEELHQDRISFFTNIAHELQTPLTLIMGSIERFIDKTMATRGQSGKPYFLSLIHQQASRLTYLVQQLLEFRKGEAGFSKNQYSYFNISELLTNLAEPFIPLGEQHEKNYAIKISPGLVGWIDKDKLEKIIFNLLSNAFKHSQKHEQILFSASSDTDRRLEIKIANSGCQLPEDQLDKLFDKFYVAGTSPVGTEKFGTGIGLAFTRQLVTLLDGQINVSNLDGWISFSVSLPLRVSRQEEDSVLSTHPGKPSYLYESITAYGESSVTVSTLENNKQAIIENLEENSRKNILLVEDEMEIRYLLKDILKDDYIIYEAEDGAKAIELMRRIVPDLIICDIMMPNTNGLELCDKIKNTPATCHIPFIILSARDTLEQHMEGYESGADAYIAKPFHTAHLKLRIRKLLEYKQKLHEFFKADNATDDLAASELPDNDKQFLQKLIIIIEENMDEPEFGAVQIEKMVGMSKMQLYRKLKTLTGMTPGEFIKHIRLKQAGHLLATTKLTVSEIFHRTGFNNQSYFFREFKKRYNCAPNEYRAQQTRDPWFSAK